MTHPVYPTFPSNPTIGQVYDSGASGIWEFTSIGWVKKVIKRNDLYPMWGGRINATPPA